MPVKMCSFVSLLVKSDVIYKVRLPIGKYFIWTDDYEFTGRISRIYPCYMISGSKVTHTMKNHTRVNFAADDIARIDRYHYIYRNDVHCYRRYGLLGWIYIIFKDMYTIFNILKNSKEGKMEKMKVVVKGFGEGVKFNPAVEMCSGPLEKLGGMSRKCILIYAVNSFRMEGAA